MICKQILSIMFLNKPQLILCTQIMVPSIAMYDEQFNYSSVICLHTVK